MPSNETSKILLDTLNILQGDAVNAETKVQAKQIADRINSTITGDLKANTGFQKSSETQSTLEFLLNVKDLKNLSAADKTSLQRNMESLSQSLDSAYQHVKADLTESKAKVQEVITTLKR